MVLIGRAVGGSAGCDAFIRSAGDAAVNLSRGGAAGVTGAFRVVIAMIIAMPAAVARLAVGRGHRKRGEGEEQEGLGGHGGCFWLGAVVQRQVSKGDGEKARLPNHRKQGLFYLSRSMGEIFCLEPLATFFLL